MSEYLAVYKHLLDAYTPMFLWLGCAVFVADLALMAAWKIIKRAVTARVKESNIQ